MANHGYLPHDGRGITKKNIADALAKGINFDPEASFGILKLAFEKIGNPEVIDLEDLDAHGATEHDASLTREDDPEDTIHFSKARLNALLADSKETYLNVESLAKSRTRVEASVDPLPDFFQFQVLAEAALLLQVMSKDPVPAMGTSETWRKLQAPKDRIILWITREKLPVELGWSVPSQPLVNSSLSAIADEIGAAKE